MIVRPLVLADAPAVAVIHVETWHDTYRGLLPDAMLDAMQVPERTEFWQKALSQPNPGPKLLSVGAFADGELLGIAGAGVARDELGFESEFWAINIPQRFQKRGAGKQLLLACVDYCLSLGAKSMYLWCIGGNTNAMEFYYHFGAVDTGHRKEHDHRCLAFADLAALRQRLTR